MLYSRDFEIFLFFGVERYYKEQSAIWMVALNGELDCAEIDNPLRLQKRGPQQEPFGFLSDIVFPFVLLIVNIPQTLMCFGEAVKDRLIWMQNRLASMSVVDCPIASCSNSNATRSTRHRGSSDLLEGPSIHHYPHGRYARLISLNSTVEGIDEDVTVLLESSLTLLGVSWPKHQPSIGRLILWI